MNLINIEVVKEQYQRMPDEELIRFAKDESHNLTMQSFHLLKSEFEFRNLDLTVIEDARITRELEEATKLSEFEKVTAVAYTETIWKFAFDQKEKGKSDKEIHNTLIKKNINPDYADMIIESIEPRSRELVDSFDTEIIVGWILLALGIPLSMLIINSKSTSIIFVVWGPLLVIGGIVRLSTSYSNKKKYQTILSNIKDEESFENNLYQ